MQTFVPSASRCPQRLSFSRAGSASACENEIFTLSPKPTHVKIISAKISKKIKIAETLAVEAIPTASCSLPPLSLLRVGGGADPPLPPTAGALPPALARSTAVRKVRGVGRGEDKGGGWDSE